MRSSIGAAALGPFRDPWVVATAYMLLGGGLMSGIFVAELRLLGVGLGVAVVALWVAELSRAPDALDLAGAAALVLLALGAMFSTQPRVSVEYVAWAIALVATLALLRRRFVDAAARDRLLSVGGWIGIGVAVAVAAIWTWEAIGWPLAGGPGTLPPLQLDLSDDWFRNVNVLPIYLALLAPGAAHLWTVRGTRVPVAVGVVAASLVALLSASRAAWLGLAAGLVVFVVLVGIGARPRLGPRVGRAVIGTVLVVGVLAIVTGFVGGLVAEATDFATVGSRVAIWNAALATWRDGPVTGSGLGTMPAQLLEHGLAAVGRGPAPHAHSVPIQLLAEAGLLGAAAMALLGAALVVRARRAPRVGHRAVSAAAAGGLVAFVVGGLADNHTALGAIALLVVANAALLAPAHPAARPDRPPHPWLRRATVMGLGVVAAAVLVWGAGAVAWNRSQGLVLEGRYESAVRVLGLAAALDPGLALYPREVAKGHLLVDDAAAAERLLQRAAATNAGDPNPWRTLGAIRLADDRAAEALEPLRRALELDATQPGGHLLLGMARDELGDTAGADASYRTAILRQPRLLLSDGWRGLGVDPERLEAVADAAWHVASTEGAASPSRAAELAVVRADLAGLERLLAEASVPAEDSWRAALAAELGDLARAQQLLTRSETDGRTAVDHWANAALVHELAGDRAARDRDYRLASMLREGRAPATSEPPLAYPVTRDSNDFWMYARSTAWLTVDVGLRLPDPQRGGWLRLHEPDRIELPSARAPRVAAAAPGSARR